MGVIQLMRILLRALLANRAALAMESLALRQQLAVLEQSQTPRPAATRPYLLGLAGQTLERLAVRSAHRQARDRHQVAAAGLPTLLVMEVASPQAGSPQDQA